MFFLLQNYYIIHLNHCNNPLKFQILRKIKQQYILFIYEQWIKRDAVNNYFG